MNQKIYIRYKNEKHNTIYGVDNKGNTLYNGVNRAARASACMRTSGARIPLSGGVLSF